MSGVTLEKLKTLRKGMSTAQYEEVIGTGNQPPLDYDRTVKDDPIPFQEFTNLGVAVVFTRDGLMYRRQAPDCSSVRTLALKWGNTGCLGGRDLGAEEKANLYRPTMLSIMAKLFNVGYCPFGCSYSAAGSLY